MRILMVVRPAAGGMKEHVLALSRGLVNQGDEVELAAPSGSEVAEAARSAGLPTHEIGLVGPLHPLRDPSAVRELRRIAAKGAFDVVHAHGFKAGLVARLAVRLLPRSSRPGLVVTAHNHVLFREDVPASAKTRYRFVERSLSGLVDRYIAVSRSICLELVDGYGLPAEKVVVIHNGIDPAPFLAQHDRASLRAAFDLPADVPVVGLAARFSAQKGLRHLIAAVPALKASHPGLVVAIGGSGPLESELREQARALGVEDTVRWLGYIPDMATFLPVLDVYVSPAETEALGIALIEAALSGVPTVATAVGGVPEVVENGKTGLLVAPRDPIALVVAVGSLLDDPVRASSIARAAREKVLAEFAFEPMIYATSKAYREVSRG